MPEDPTGIKRESPNEVLFSYKPLRATADFVVKGEQIANLEMRNELMTAVDDVRKTGDARNLLSAVARLLILADEIDVRKLLKSLHVVRTTRLSFIPVLLFDCISVALQVEANLERFHNATSQQELVDQYQVFNSTIGDLTMKAALRQRELKDHACDNQ
jgi:hypothetical protein